MGIKEIYLPADKVKKSFFIFFLITVFGISASIFAQENSLGKYNLFNDFDQDGLSDSEELTYGTDPKNPDTDGDGYSDGAEVKSGYDPLKPAPGDKIITEEKTKNATSIESDIYKSDNLTEEISAKLAALASENNTAVGQAVSMETINAMIEESLSENIKEDELPEVNKDEIKIKEQNYSNLSEEKRAQQIKKDEEEYLSAVFYIVANNLPHDINSEESIKSFFNEFVSKIGAVSSNPGEIEYFNDLAERGQTILDLLNEIEVPESAIDIHIEGLQLAKYAISLKDKVKIDMNDPIASMLSFSGVERLMVMTTDFSEKVESRFLKRNSTSNNVSLDNKDISEEKENEENSEAEESSESSSEEKSAE
ncbi:MAG: hypothetical protein WCR65_02000 [Parcubacteria group bacterium]|jgi:hypothetical protein